MLTPHQNQSYAAALERSLADDDRAYMVASVSYHQARTEGPFNILPVAMVACHRKHRRVILATPMADLTL